MKTWIVRLLVLLGVSSPAVGADVDIQEGQCWSYNTRAGEETSFVVIRKVEVDARLGEIIHISVFGLKFPNPNAPGGFTTEAGHLPVAGRSVRSSLKERIDRVAPTGPDWREGYKMWREAFDAGKAGVFTISIGECVGVIEEAAKRNGG